MCIAKMQVDGTRVSTVVPLFSSLSAFSTQSLV